MTRLPITPERMPVEASKAQIIYRSDEVHPRHQANCQWFFDHLGFPTAGPRLRAPPDQPMGRAAAQPCEWSYEPLGDALPLRDPLLG
jgi:hypothetical protein